MLLNLHTHSNYSDGRDSLGQLVQAFQANGHVCLCLTDHDYSLTLYAFQKQQKEAAELSKVEEFPIICGLEVSCGEGEEALLFGTRACEEWLALRQVNDLLPMGSGYFREGQFLKWARGSKQEKALVLCHPTMRAQIEGFYDVFDGYEIQNSGCLWPEDILKLMERVMPKAKAFKNYDLHTLSVFWGLKNSQKSYPCNESPDDLSIKNEADLIRYIKG
jgi:hypothetical protein